MSFENLSKIVGGKLLNSPAIGSFNEIKTSLKRLNYGDIFLSDDDSEIASAVKLGAAGIVTSDIKDIIDNEIAWIEVKDLKDAVIKTLRFIASNKSFKAYFFDEITTRIILAAVKKREILRIDRESLKDMLEVISTSDQKIVISSDRELLENIFPSFEEFCQKADIKEIGNGLFKMSFLYGDKLYKDVTVSPIFKEELSRAIGFLEVTDVEFSLERLDMVEHFHPIYISKNFKIKNFGESEHLFIVEESVNLLEREIEFLKKEARWAKSIALVHREYKEKFRDKDGIIFFDSYDEIFKMEIFNFNFILIVANYNEFYKRVLNYSDKKSPSLFEEF
jgi:ferrochelatase